MTASPSLHHVVFAVALERHDAVAQMFTELGFTLTPTELSELGLRISLDWGHGIEVISPIPGSTAPVSASVSAFLDSKGDGTHLKEIDLSVFGLPLTLLDTNIP